MPSLRSLVIATFLAVPPTVFGTFPTLYLKPVCLSQLNSPVNVVNAGDGSGRLFITDQPGKIYIFQNGMLLPTPFLDITSKCVPQSTGYSERGLLGLTFHPGYSNAASPGYHKFYVYYSAPASTATSNPSSPQDHVATLAEYQVSATNPNLADITTERILLSFGAPQSNHNGGQIEFGPDGTLYMAVGDGGQANDNYVGHTGGSTSTPSGGLGNAQDRTKLLGKILRVDPQGTNGPGGQYGIPADNPFVGQGGGIRQELYAIGLRNPWRFSFDKRTGGTGRLFCADVGQDNIEEVDLITNGGNYGWRILEGTASHDSTAPNPSGITLTGPIAQYAHPGASTSIVGSTPQLGVSVTGGYVYRGTAIPTMQGKYVFADYGSSNGRLMGLEETSPGVFALTQTIPMGGGNPLATHVLTLGEDESGELYLGTKVNGGVLQLDSNNHPAGAIYQLVGTAPTATWRDTWLSTYFPNQPVGFYLDDNGDNDSDGVSNQLEYAYGFSPLAKNNPADGLAAAITTDVTGSSLTITFRRDPRATDLTYLLQISDDLVTWNTIVTSDAGGAPTGPGFVAEADIAGSSPVKLVTALKALGNGVPVRQFVRLQVNRAP